MYELAKDPASAARYLQRAQEAVRDASVVLNEPVPPLYRLFERRRQQRSVRDAHRQLVISKDAEADACRQLVHLAAGADEAEWGVFNVAWQPLEDTLRQLKYVSDIDEQLVAFAEDLRDRLASARAATALGDQRGRKSVEDAVAALARNVPESLRQELTDHLPVRLRPVATTIREVERFPAAYTLSLSEQYGVITIHDVAVHIGAGHGFGTSLLQEVCRYADSIVAPIECEMVPTSSIVPIPNPDEATIAKREVDRIRLASWYHRHGFTWRDSPSDQWPSGAGLRREPTTRTRHDEVGP